MFLFLFDAKAVIVQLDHWQEQVTYRRDDDVHFVPDQEAEWIFIELSIE
jgi:hypothetical protein